MKKQLFNVLLCSLLPLTWLHAQSTVAEGQSTEGKDFWVTFMQADQDDNNSLQLQLSISSREDCSVTIDNPFTSYSETVNVTAGEMKLVTLYSGNVLSNNARTAMASTGKVCYAVNSEKVDTCALHVTSTKNISLFATNYKKATFDATNVLPTASLLDEYYIQTYTPSDHGGTSSTQGSHFAIIAAEDNTVVEYVPTVETKSIRDFLTQYNNWGDDVFEMYPQYERFRHFHAIGDTILSDTLMAGQVYYVWTGKKDSVNGDLSGTYVKARDGKKIAVFQGCPHTNIPYQVKQRDHIFSQAMPTQYWGNTFVLTASASRPCDAIRILALNDGTEVLTAAVAEFSVGRLFTRTTNKTRLVITQRSNGQVVFDIPVVDYFLMVKGYYAHEMGDQEYLDRQDDYSIVIFLEHKEGPEEYYIAARIYINGWQIVFMNPDLY